MSAIERAARTFQRGTECHYTTSLRLMRKAPLLGPADHRLTIVTAPVDEDASRAVDFLLAMASPAVVRRFDLSGHRGRRPHGLAHLTTPTMCADMAEASRELGHVVVTGRPMAVVLEGLGADAVLGEEVCEHLERLVALDRTHVILAMHLHTRLPQRLLELVGSRLELHDEHEGRWTSRGVTRTARIPEVRLDDAEADWLDWEGTDHLLVAGTPEGRRAAMMGLRRSMPRMGVRRVGGEDFELTEVHRQLDETLALMRQRATMTHEQQLDLGRLVPFFLMFDELDLLMADQKVRRGVDELARDGLVTGVHLVASLSRPDKSLIPASMLTRPRLLVGAHGERVRTDFFTGLREVDSGARLDLPRWSALVEFPGTQPFEVRLPHVRVESGEHTRS